MSPRFLIAPLVSISLAASAAPTFHVSPSGDDGNPGNRTKPFATLHRARDAARAATGPVTVHLAGGLYEMRTPLVLERGDSGVSFVALPGETPILSGGRRVTGWRRGPGTLWQADIPGTKGGTWYPHQLFIRKRGQAWFERRYRPSRGLLIIAGLTDAPHKHNGRINQLSYITTWNNVKDILSSSPHNSH